MKKSVAVSSINYIYWLNLAHWTLTQAVFLLCGEQPIPEREGERRTSEHREAEAWLRACGVRIFQVKSPKLQNIGLPSQWMTPGVRPRDVLAALHRQENPQVWGRGLIDAYGEFPGQRRREHAMWRFLDQCSAKQRGGMTSVKHWHDALRAFAPDLFELSLASFENHFWKHRCPALKKKAPLHDKAS